jgi:hypothetical protein
MIARFQYLVRGNEVEGDSMVIQTPAIGASVLDVIVGGSSYMLGEEMNSETGVLVLPFTLPKRSIIEVLYRKLPRFRMPEPAPPPMPAEFSSDFNSDFVI